MGDLKGCPKYDLISFIKHRVNTKMSDLGYDPIVNGIDQDAVQRMSWFDSLSAGKQHTDFFANRVTNYSKGVQNWDSSALFLYECNSRRISCFSYIWWYYVIINIFIR